MNNFDIEKFDIEKFDLTKNYVIEASAGTGKTYTILEIIKKLLLNNIHLQEILVVTYTEKATGELKNRLRQCIYDNKSSFQEEFYNIDNAQIFTIHGFCQNVLQEFAFNANLTLQQELISDSDTDNFLLQWLTDKVKNKDDDIIKILNNGWDIDKIKNILKELLKHYYLNNKYEEDEKIISFVKNLNDIDGFTENLKTLESLKDSGDDRIQGFYNEIQQYIKEGYVSFNGNIYQERYFKNEQMKKVFKFFKSLKSASQDTAKNTPSLSQLLVQLYTDLQKYKIQNKVQTFNDMLRSVREEICKKGSPLLLALRKKYKYVIIDEFQDTNQIQWDIFRNIFMQDTDHHLIVVGDPKQAIYSFQGADLIVYQRAKEEIKKAGGLIKKLTDNWRSSKYMIDACNALFQENFFCWNDNIKFTESSFPENSKHTVKMKFHGDDKIEPIWLCNDCTESSFANIVVKKIIECCSFDENGKTNLQICDNGKLRNVYFNDFAIIARKRDNMKDIEENLTKFGVPFVKYKDTNLFNGSECANWIMLLKAIDSNDFTGNKRKVLNGGLFTKFFNIKINDLENSEYDDVSNDNRQLFIHWHNLAKSHQWAKLIESIFENTRIEENLSSMDNLQTLSIYRQTSNYILDYLYKNRCSLKKVIKHLIQISSRESAVENDENIIEKGTDFNCVKLMTIHSSKGLEFPIVINASAEKENVVSNNKQVVFTHHDSKANKVINLFPVGKECYKQEAIAELQRLFYVSYTRASSLMILPCYTEWEEDYSFLNDVFKKFKENYTGTGLYLGISQEQDDFKYTVKDIIKNISKSDGVIKNITTDIVEERQKLIRKIPDLLIYKHSYSSLSHGKKETEEDLTNDNSKRIDSEGAIDVESLAMYDMNGKSIDCKYNQDVKKPISEDAPRGATFGTAIHEVLENTDFNKIGKLSVDDSADKLMPTIIKCFEKQSIHVDTDKINLWNIPRMIFDTLNAEFPEIIGHKATGDVFQLSSLMPNQCKPEIEFNLNTEIKFKNYYDGFIDLLFVRIVNGKPIYSILDWKTDYLQTDDYIDKDAVKKQVDDKYSIQRVLYSYCLIKWLKQFNEYKNMTEHDIFENHFGGIYYVLLRGCVENTGNGIYAHTWLCWEDLEDAFNNIVKEKVRK